MYFCTSEEAIYFLMNFPILNLLVTITRTGLHVQKTQKTNSGSWLILLNTLPRKDWKHVQYIDLNRNIFLSWQAIRSPEAPAENTGQHVAIVVGLNLRQRTKPPLNTGHNNNRHKEQSGSSTKQNCTRTVCPYPCSVNGDTTFIASKQKSN